VTATTPAIRVALSRAQRGEWAHLCPHPGVRHRLISLTYSVRGPLDVDRLGRAFLVVLARQEQLRLRIVGPADDPVAEVLPVPEDFPIPVIDLRGTGAATRERLRLVYGERDASRPLDPSRDLPLRATLLRLSDVEHELLLSVSHLVCDGWGTGVILRELRRAYLGADPAALTPARPYREHVARSEERHRRGDYEQAARWWWSELEGLPPAGPLGAAGRPHHLRDTAWHRFDLPPGLAGELRGLAGEASVTPYTVLLAALAATLARRSGSAEVVVFASVAGERFPDFEDTVGLFSGRIPLRLPGGDGATFRQLLTAARERVLGAWEHAEVPYSMLEARCPEDVLPSHVLLQLVADELCGPGPADDQGPRFALEEFRAVLEPFGLIVFVVERGDGTLWGEMTHHTGALSPSEAQAFLAELLGDLLHLVADPDLPVRMLPRRPVTVTWR
jgi:Condensation domain